MFYGISKIDIILTHIVVEGKGETVEHGAGEKDDVELLGVSATPSPDRQQASSDDDKPTTVDTDAEQRSF